GDPHRRRSQRDRHLPDRRGEDRSERLTGGVVRGVRARAGPGSAPVVRLPAPDMSAGVLSPEEAERSGGRSGRPPAAMLVLASCGVLFVALPLIGLLVRAPWGSARSILTSPVALDALRLSLIVSVSATALTLLLGFPLAWILARVEFTGSSVVRALVTLPL